MAVFDRSELEASPLADLHAIANQLGLDGFRRLRKADLIDAILRAIDNPAAHRQTFNVCMDEPVDYGALGAYLAASRGLETVPVRTPYHSTWLDNAKAKFLLGWRPRYDLEMMVDAAWSYRRASDDPRKVWYPG